MSISKLSFVVIAVLASFLAFSALTRANPGAASKADWNTDFQFALKEAQSSNKPVMLYFTGSKWCPPCMATDRELFSQEAFIDYANENLVLVKLDFTRTGEPVAAEHAGEHNRLREGYGIQGFPTLVLISPEGDLIEKTLAYRRGGPERYVEFLDGLLASN